MNHLNYRELADEAIDAGGFTISYEGKRPTRGYVVSTRPDAEFTTTPNQRRSIATAIEAYVVANAHDLREGYYLGAWFDDGRLVLDLVEVYEHGADAIRLAIAHNQAIYDIAERRVINLPTRPTPHEHGLDDLEGREDDPDN